MRIPDAYFSGGLGQKVPRLKAGPTPDASGAQAIGAAGRRLGGALMGLADDMIGEQQQQQREREQETERLERLKQKSEATSALFSHENALSETVRTLAGDASLSPEEKRDRFRQESEKTRARLFQDLPEEYRYAFAPAFDEHRVKAGGHLDEAIRKDVRSQARGHLFDGLEALERSPKPLSEKLLLLREVPEEVWDGAGVDADGRAREIQKRAELMTEAELDGRLNSEDPRQVLKDLRATTGEGGDYSHYADLSPKGRQAYIRTARSLIERQEREAERRRKEERQERARLAREAFGQYKELREGLFPIDPKQEAGFWKLVAGTEYEEKARQVRKETGALGFVAGKVKEDPLKYGAAQLGLDVPPLSVDDPAAWPAQLAARGQVAGIIKEQHGLPYLPVLTNDEAEGLAGLFQTQAPRAQVQTIKGLRQGLGKESVQAIARQFAGQDPDLGMLVGLAAAGRERAAYHVADGRRLLGEKAVPLSAVLKQDMRRRFDGRMEDSLAGLPQVREGFFRAAQSAYVSLLAGREVPDDSLDKKVFAEALQLVVGGKPAKINGKHVLVPDGLSEEQFLDNFERIDAAQVEAAGGVLGFKSAEEAAEAIRDDAEPWESGGGRYRFAIDGRFLMTADGSRPLVLNLSDMAGMRIPVGPGG